MNTIVTYNKNISFKEYNSLNIFGIRFIYKNLTENEFFLLIQNAKNELSNRIKIIIDLVGVKPLIYFKGELEFKNEEIIEISLIPFENAKISMVNFTCNINILKNEYIYFADKSIVLSIISISRKNIFCKVVKGGHIKSGRSITFSNDKIVFKALSDLDYNLLQNIDKSGIYFAISFCHNIDIVNELIIQFGISSEKIIPKIEKKIDVNILNSIIGLTKYSILGRGDLFSDNKFKENAIFQLTYINQCLKFKKKPIIATGILESLDTLFLPKISELSELAMLSTLGVNHIMLTGNECNEQSIKKSIHLTNSI